MTVARQRIVNDSNSRQMPCQSNILSKLKFKPAAKTSADPRHHIMYTVLVYSSISRCNGPPVKTVSLLKFSPVAMNL